MKKKLLPFALLAASIAGMAIVATASVHGLSNNELDAIAGTTAQAKFMVTFNPCNGKVEDIVEKTGKSGRSVLIPDAPSRAGYGFVGWSTKYNPSTRMGTPDDLYEGEKYTFGTENQVLYGVWLKGEAHTEEEIDAYMSSVTENSQDGHLYYHYYRYDNSPASYNPWDVWAWPYKPDAGQGYRFNWVGRVTDTTSPTLEASGDATVDSFGYANIDIDLNATYDAGWNNNKKTVGGTEMTFKGAEQIGLQIVQSATRTSGGSEFWVNDGSNLYIKLDDYAVNLQSGGTAYHIFVTQDDVQNPLARPAASNDDPFENDDGTNVTYGNADYQLTADQWKNTAAKAATASQFKNGIGVGYQIMISSFADSDGDGFGDIYGIEQKLDYLKGLGVKALWLTPVQLSDSYHGYDITDYTKIDPKFGSKVSPAGTANKGEVTSDTALEDYKSLIKAAHDNQMVVIMDLVLNHTSTSNAWFTASANLKEEYRGYYQWGNHETQSSVIKEEACWYPYGDHPYSFYAKFGSSMPELNYGYQATRDAVIKMSKDWCALGVDGFRLDAVKHIFMQDEVAQSSGDIIIQDVTTQNGREVNYSSNLTKNLHFFRELNASIKKDYPNAFFVGENFDGAAYQVAPYYEGFDSMFDFYTYYNLTSIAANVYRKTENATASGFMQSTSMYNGVCPEKGQWNLPSVLKTYNKYRGDTAMPGAFTSNHDIARTVNRVAGTLKGNGEVDQQGNVNASNYGELESLANCVKAAEILMPGLTWIYYGDEIGLAGNFPAKDIDGEPFTSQSAYSDLYYRQPMKWVDNGEVGDGKGTTEYNVTGTTISVELDAFNKSSTVRSVDAQLKDGTSGLAKLKQVIAYKNANPSIISGTLEDDGSQNQELKFKVGNIHVSVNFKSHTVTATGGNGADLNVTF